MLIYDPDNNNNPEIWPNNATDEVKTLIHNYKLAKENCGSTTTTTTTTTALGPRRSKKRALDLTDIDVKDSNTSEASNKKRKSAAGSSSSSSSVPDLWDGLDIDGLPKNQMFDLLSNLDRKIGGLQKRIDDHVAMKPYQYSEPAAPLHMLDLLASSSSSSSSNEYSFQTTATATYPPGYFQNLIIDELFIS